MPRLPRKLAAFVTEIDEEAAILHYRYSIDQLDYYLDEFTFPFNRRTARSRGLLFYRLLQQAVATDPHPYRELTAAARLDHYLWT
jgi:hypothetical protein